MSIFEIFKNPVEMIETMSRIQVAGKQYKKDHDPNHILYIEKQITSLEGHFINAGVPGEITKIHSGIIFEMALKGENIPPLVALEDAIQAGLKEGDLVLEDTGWLTSDEDDIVEKMIRNLEEEGDE